MKKKVQSADKAQAAARRKLVIEAHGQKAWTKGSFTFKSKKKYSRKVKINFN
jgi:hypothetical protein